MSTKPTKLKFKGSKRKSKSSDRDSEKLEQPQKLQKLEQEAKFSFDDYDFIEAEDPKISIRDEWMLNMGENNIRTEETKPGKFTKEVQGGKVPNTVPVDIKVNSSAPQLRDSYDVPYEFGDSGSSWRMMKLRKLLRTSDETKKPPEIVALERYGNLLDYDIAREEQKELEDRKNPLHTKKYKPTGYFYHQREFENLDPEANQEKGEIQQSGLNELRAKVLKAKIQKALNFAELDLQYKEMEKAFNSQNAPPEDSHSELDPLSRMVMEEKLTKNNKDLIRESVKSIMKDKKFSADLDEQDEKLSSLAEKLRDGELKASGDDLTKLSKLNKSLDKCHLCLRNNKPVPIIHQSEVFAIALAPHPAITSNTLTIFPLKHYTNSLQFEPVEVHELKQIMLTLSNFYYEKLNKKVIFYELSVSNTGHCSIMAVPLPLSIDDRSIYEYFKNGIIEESNDLEQQHKIIIDTRERTYDRLIPKEAPFFHLWLTIDGGIAHIVEEDNWPRGDLFARRVIGGILRLDRFDVEAKTRYYVGEGVTDELLRSFKRQFEGYKW